MGSAFGLGFQQGTGAAQNNAQRKETLDLLQRQFLANQYEQYANNIPLPSAQADPEGYKKALDLRTKALESAQKVYAPDHHATLGDHLHGLIFGQKQAPQPQASPVPVSSGAPVAPMSTAPPPAPQAQPQAAPEHPFASNPAYSKILDGLKGLGNHLKAAVNPNPQAPPTTSLADFAGAPTSEDNKRVDMASAAKNAQDLEKLKAASAAEVARIRSSGGSSASSLEKAHLDKYAQEHFGTSYADAAPEQQVEAVADWKQANTAPARPSSAALATYLRAKYGDNPTAEQIAQGTREHQAMMAGVTVGTHQQLVFDDHGVPHVIDLHSRSGKDFGATGTPPPKSSKAPDLAAVNGQIANGNANSKKLNKGKPKSSQAPDLGFTKGDPTVKSDAAQYTKVAEDANSKKEAYESARRALASGSTASSDQELLYSWVRANVQGAGRMTQAEFKLAASTGSLPQRAQAAWEKLKTGKLPPAIENMLMADIKRSYEVSSAEAADLRGRLNEGSAPAQPQSTPQSKTGFDWNSLPSAQ